MSETAASRILDSGGTPFGALPDLDDEDPSPTRFTVTLDDDGATDRKDPTNPVQNDGPLPLFPGADKRSSNFVTHIRVIKTNEPDSGYRGDAPNTADINWIGQRFGDGMYDFEACNETGKVLRERRGVGIRMQGGPTGSTRGAADPIAVMKETSAMHSSAARQAREQSHTFVEMVRTTLNAQRDADRESNANERERTGQFFSSMFSNSEAAADRRAREDDARHERSMQAQREGHNQMMLGMGQLNAMTLAIMSKGIEMAQADGHDDEPYVRAITESVKGLDKLAEIAQHTSTKRLPANGKANGKDNGKAKAGADGKRLPKIARNEIIALAQLKKLCDARGLNMEEMVKNATDTISGLTDEQVEQVKNGQPLSDAPEDDDNPNDEGRDQSSPEDDGKDSDKKPPADVDN